MKDMANSSFLTPFVAGVLAGTGLAGPLTYCNPMSLPDIPISRNVRDPVPEQKDRLQYRELADPTLLVEGKAIYVYPSNDLAWKSTDGGATWTKIDIGVRDIGYAPTVVKHGGRYLLMSGTCQVFAAASPEGPFAEIGRLPWPGGVPAPADTAMILWVRW